MNRFHLDSKKGIIIGIVKEKIGIFAIFFITSIFLAMQL